MNIMAKKIKKARAKNPKPSAKLASMAVKMETNMDEITTKFLDLQGLINTLKGLVDQVSALEQQLVDAEAAVTTVRAESFALGKAEGDAEGYQRGYAEGYTKGFEEGVLSIPVSDKIFSQAEVDAIVQPLNDKISALEVKVFDLETQIANMPPAGFTQEQLDAAVADAKAAMKIAFDAVVNEYLANEQIGDDQLKQKLSEI